MKSKAHEPTRKYWQRLIRQHAGEGKDRSRSKKRGKSNMRQPRINEKAKLPVLAQRIREAMGGVSQRKSAESLGICYAEFNYYCTGVRIPNVLTLMKIAEKAGVTTDWLLDLSDFKTQGIPEIASIAKAAHEGAIKFYIEGQTLYIQSAITGERVAIGEEKRVFDGGRKPEPYPLTKEAWAEMERRIN